PFPATGRHIDGLGRAEARAVRHLFQDTGKPARFWILFVCDTGNLAAGTYQLRLLANDGVNVLATSNNFTIASGSSTACKLPQAASRTDVGLRFPRFFSRLSTLGTVRVKVCSLIFRMQSRHRRHSRFTRSSLPVLSNITALFLTAV